MLTSYFKIVIRSISGHKMFSFVTIVGLAVGMSASLLMLMYVVNETRYEDFQKNGDRIFRVGLEWGRKGNKMKFAGAMAALAPAMVSELPEVEKAVRTELLEEIPLRKSTSDNPVTTEYAIYADPDFFSMFSYPWIAGNREQALQQPYAVVLDRHIAEALFGTTDVIGRTVLYEKTMLQVTGVMERAPLNTHLTPDVIISRSTMEAMTGQKAAWVPFGGVKTYVLLKEGTDLPSLNGKIQELAKKHIDPGLATMFIFHLHPLKEIHWISDFMGDVDRKGNRLYLSVFLTASILVLVIACANYINLTSSRYLERMREIGIRKVFGATRNRLLGQLMMESVLISLLAMSIGVVAFFSDFKRMMDFIQAPIVMSLAHLPYVIGVFALVLLAAMIAALIPAWTLSRFQPVDILGKGATQPRGKSMLRRALLALQFVIAVVLIIGTAVIYAQLHFMLTTDLGFKKDSALVVPFFPAQEEMRGQYNAICQELQKLPSIVSVSSASLIPGAGGMSNMTVFKEKTDMASGMTMMSLAVDYDFIDALGLQLGAGRSFSRANTADSADGILINEEAARVLAYEYPVNSLLKVPRGENQLKDFTILGVVKNFHLQSLHMKIPPMVIFLRPQSVGYLVVRYQPSQYQQVLEYVRETLNRMIPGKQMNIRMLEEAYARYYLAEEKTATMLTGFSLVALLLSCAGLFGMTSFMIGRRVKEIGIRKVLGASTRVILVSLSREYILLVLLANCVGWPLAYLAATSWLEQFAYRVSLSPWIFVLSACFTLAIAMLTIGTKVVQTARMNPATSLRYE